MSGEWVIRQSRAKPPRRQEDFLCALAALREIARDELSTTSLLTTQPLTTFVRLLRRQPIADPWLGQQISRREGIMNFAPQTGDEDAQIVRLLRVMRTPYFLQKKTMGKDFAGVADQRGQ